LSADSPFWQFSLRFYRRAGVAEACIALQDECGADVNLLLLLLWLGCAGRQLSATELRGIEERSRVWAQAVVAPLRAVRRALKSRNALIDPDVTESFRAKIKAIELEAEGLQQDALYHVAQNPELGFLAPSAEAAIQANIALYENLVGRTFARGAIETLLGAIKDEAAEG
jgi:uncharacterized protein (TIGR02444 family)